MSDFDFDELTNAIRKMTPLSSPAEWEAWHLRSHSVDEPNREQSPKECADWILMLADRIYQERAEKNRIRQDAKTVEVLMKMEIKDSTLYFVLTNDLGVSRYWYEEGTCPVNFMGDIHYIYEVKDGQVEEDPHGIFSLVGYREAAECGKNGEITQDDFHSGPNPHSEAWLKIIHALNEGRDTGLQEIGDGY